MNSIRKRICTVVVAATLAAAGPALAGAARDGMPVNAGGYGYAQPGAAGHAVTQRGGMTLSQAVESVRSDPNVERVISAETTVSNGREVHVIKVLTKDGKVRTYRIPGQTRN